MITRVLGVLALLMTMTSAARAQESEPPPPAAPAPGANPRNALSVPLLAILNGGVAVQYERFLAPPRVSLATSIGARWSGGHDFDTFEGTFGTEGRIWLVGKEPFSKFDRPAMVGPYLGLRLDLGLTKVSQDGHVLGSSMAVSEAILLGFRLAFLRTIEITPNIGFGLRTELDPSGRLAAWTRAELVRFGVMAGVLF